MGRAEMWAARSGCAAAAAMCALLLFTPWRLSWAEQLVVAAVVGLQLQLITVLAERRVAHDHLWLQGYFAAVDDLSREADRP